jgi:hypothetical protein
MAKNYPTIGEYNQLIQQKGGSAFRILNGINLIPSKTSPIKIYLFGSGAFAAVFKGSLDGRTYAIRCFLSAEDETKNRYKSICRYLENIHSSWKTECEFIENEISLGGNSYPILKMEWIDGILINQFVTEHLNENDVLSDLQAKLVSVSADLEKNKIGHGDIQCGNIMVIGSSSNFQIKLIDYDGMFIPELGFKKAIENGRSEFQHPRRSVDNFCPEMDRFSFWVIITAIEAIKIDKTLWRELMQGGYNTLDNFLFTIQDFSNPRKSALFIRLNQLNSTSLNFYLETLIGLCDSEFSIIPPPEVYEKSSASSKSILKEIKKNIHYGPNIDNTVSTNTYKITTANCTASVLTSTFKIIGSTPLELDKQTYDGKLILISNGKVTKQVKLDSSQSLIEIIFD